MGQILLSASFLAVLLFGLNTKVNAEDGSEIATVALDFSAEYSVEEEIDSEEILNNYIDSSLDNLQNPVYMSSTFNGSKLDGTSRIIYDKGKIMIAEVAAGERANSTFDITADDLGGYKYYTASELGVSSLVVGGAIPEDAMYAFMGKYGLYPLDLTDSFDALLSDCPYERYWMGLQCKLDTDATISVYFSDGEYRIGFTKNKEAKFVYKVPVSVDYRGGDEYTANTAKTGAVKASIKCVNDIINQAKSKNDRQKIEYYRDCICDLVEYNYDAYNLSLEDSKKKYGNPWQLVYVFDQDPATNVVCEGYSKAFMYLCDRTDFSDSSINCYIVSGDMDTEGHMWNIIHWSDNKNYMIDVTNSDGMMPRDGLFMVTPTSGDINNGYVFKVYSTNITYKYNERTRKTYSDSELTLNVANSTGLQDIFVNYDSLLVCEKEAAFTVVREGGTNNCKFRLDSATDEDGNSILGSYSPQYVNENVFYLTFHKKGKYTLKFSAKDSDNTEVSGKTIVVEVKDTSEINNPSNLTNEVSTEQEAQIRSFVVRFYKEVLGRSDEQIANDKAGVDDWTNKLVTKQKTGADVARGFAMSKEFTNKNLGDDAFLKTMYRAFFDREPDEGGYNGWMTKMNNGTSREAVIAGFVNSQEFKNLCAKYGINPGEMKVSKQGQQNNNNNQNNNQTVAPLKLDASGVKPEKLDEYVERLYTKILKRDSEEDGKKYWAEVIINGKDDKGNSYDAATAASKGFFNSKEYKNQNTSNEQFVVDCYAAFFNRDPRGTDDEVNYQDWVNQLNEGKITREYMIEKGFGKSKEFKNLLISYGFKIIE